MNGFVQQQGLSYLSGRGQSVRYILRDVLRWLPLATLLKTAVMLRMPHLHALRGKHITSYGRVLGTGVLHVTKDLVPCACLLARVRRNAEKNKGRLKRVFGQHFLGLQVQAQTHRGSALVRVGGASLGHCLQRPP